MAKVGLAKRNPSRTTFTIQGHKTSLVHAVESKERCVLGCRCRVARKEGKDGRNDVGVPAVDLGVRQGAQG